MTAVESGKQEVTFAFPVKSVIRPDGTLNEERMLAKTMDEMTAINCEYGYIAPEDTLLGVTFVEDDGSVLAVVRYETDEQFEKGSVQLDDVLGTTVTFS